MLCAGAIVLAAWAAAPVASRDVDHLKAEIIAATARDAGLHVEFRIINEGDAAIDVSTLFSGGGAGDRGSVAGVRTSPGAGRGGIPPLRDAGGACVCSRGITVVLPRWHLDLEADFPPPPMMPPTVTVAIPHFPPIRRIPIERPRVADWHRPR
jgi:hypothetical protein